MRILVIDIDADTRDVLVSRIHEALNQTGVKRGEIIEGDFSLFSLFNDDVTPSLLFVGPGCYFDLEESIQRLRALYPTVPMAIVLANEIYAAEAVELRKLLSNVRLMPIADIGQMVQFILDFEHAVKTSGSLASSRGLVSVCQLKGGVGGSTIAASLAACWARHDLSVVLLDLDDVNPHLTDWGGATASARRGLADLMHGGEVPSFRLNEVLTPVPGFEERLFICGQPEQYGDSFHFKADILEGVPSCADFVTSLVTVLQGEFDVVVADLGRSWGISTFATLPLSQHIVFVADDDRTTLDRSFRNFMRLYRESDDPAEFDLLRWTLVLNGFTGQGVDVAEVRERVEELSVFPDSLTMFPIPFSSTGREWSATESTLYELAEDEVRHVIEELAFKLVPFRFDSRSSGSDGSWKRKLQSFVRLK